MSYRLLTYRLIAAASTLSVFAVMLFLLRSQLAPTVSPDEAGFLSIAMYFAGKPFIEMSAAPFYGFVSGALYAPAFVMFDNPAAIYRAIMVANSMLVAACVPLLLAITRESGFRPSWLTPIAAAVISLWPSYTYTAGMAWSEATFRVVFLLTTLVALRFTERRTLSTALALAICATLTYATHARGLPVVGVAFVLFFVMWWRGLISSWVAVSGAALLIASFVAVHELNGHLIETIWASGKGPDRHYLLEHLVAAAFDFPKTMMAANVIVGHIWYQIASTVSVVIFGVYFLVKRCLGSEERLYSSAFVLLCVAGVGAASVVQMIDPLRLDHMLYGRYVDGATIVIFWFGVLAITKNQLTRMDALIAALIAAIAVAAALFLFIQSSLVQNLADAQPQNVPGIASYFWFPNNDWEVMGRPSIVAILSGLFLVALQSPVLRVAYLAVFLYFSTTVMFPKIQAQSTNVAALLNKDDAKISEAAGNRPLYWVDADRDTLWLYQLQFVLGEPLRGLDDGAPIPANGALLTNFPRPDACEVHIRSQLRVAIPCDAAR